MINPKNAFLYIFSILLLTIVMPRISTAGVEISSKHISHESEIYVEYGEMDNILSVAISHDEQYAVSGNENGDKGQK